MVNRKVTSILLLLVALTLFGCSTEPPTTVTVQSNPPALARLNTASLATDVPITLTPTPELALDATNALSETPIATPPITDTATVAESATITPTPTAPPRLPLRDDLPPMELQDFPRPKDDNGLGIHFLATGYYNEQDLDKQIARIQAMHLKWATVVYTDENHLAIAAQKFSQSGIMVIWRKTLHPYQRYSSWGRDIEILKKYGMPPYIQLYNEPELPAEWDNKEINMNLFFNNLIGAAKDVFNAGGYPGIQLLDEDDLRHFIDEIYARQGEALFKRMFFIPHAYGLNHPPDYKQDENGVLGFLNFATIFYKRLGLVPPFIIGEGGWKIDSAEDNRYPPINDQLHRDYTLAVYDWFRTGKLSNGAKLPDYLFAFNMWMLSGPDEAGAWYDSFKGDRTLTIDAVTQIPPFVRKFSWDK